MRKILVLIAAALMPLFASAQAQINTKKVKIADFTQKVTKVVLPGNAFYDGALQEEVASRWRVSPYEFCDLEEFEKQKGNSQYYFMLLTEGQFRKENEPGLQFITIVKGGPEAEKGIDNMIEVVTLPFAAADDPSGRELVFLPALLDIMQGYAVESIERDLYTLGGISAYATNLSRADDKKIVIAQEDLSNEISADLIDSEFEGTVTITDADSVDELYEAQEPNTLVSFVVAPGEPVAGSFCYKLLIDTNTNELFYFRKHRIGKKLDSGFLSEDMKRVTSHRPKQKKK